MNYKRRLLIPLVIGLVLILSFGTTAKLDDSGARKTITLYQNGPSLVIMKEGVKLVGGTNSLTRSLPATVVPETVFTASPDVSLKTAKTIPAVNSEERLLEELVGTRISLIKSGTPDIVIEGILVGIFSGKPLLRTSNSGMRLISDPDEYRFQGFSAGDKNARLELKLTAEEEVETELTVGYQLSKLNWSPQYIGLLDEEDESLDLRGIAHINNQTGWDFRGAEVKLLAGDPSRERRGMNNFLEVRSLSLQETPSPEQIFEYYRYELGFPVDLDSGVGTQVKFLHRDSVNYRKYYLFEPHSSSAVRTILELNNEENKGLGIPLASGTVRIYEDTDDKTFIGEDALPNLPVESQTELELGDAFDVKGDRKRLSHEKIEERVWKDRIELTLDNKKENPVQLLVKERMPGDWEILQSSHDYERIDSRLIQFDETLPAKETVEITYLVQYER